MARIVYTGGIHTPYLSACKLRMEILQDMGHDVMEHCDVPYYQKGRLLGRVFRRMLWGPPLWRYNKDLLAVVEKHQPDVVWIDKGRWVFPSTVRTIQQSGAKVVVYTQDSAIFFNQSRWFEQSIPLFDLVVTTKPYELEAFRQRGVRELMHKPPIYFAGLNVPPEPTPEEIRKFTCDVVFIGTFTPGRDKYLLPLVKSGFDLHIWGNGWLQRCKDKHLLQCVRGAAIMGRDYNLGLACAKLCLGLLNPLVPDTATTRSVEIPAVKGFLLAERTDEHLGMFEEGKEAEFFANEDELVKKATHYINHPLERQAIIEAGYQRCMTGGYDIESQMEEILCFLQKKV